MLPSGKCLHRIALAAATVTEFNVKNQAVRCEIAASKTSNQKHKTDPLLSSSKQVERLDATIGAEDLSYFSSYLTLTADKD
jgi:hypothetical protein